jgi:hypothetical protein
MLFRRQVATGGVPLSKILASYGLKPTPGTESFIRTLAVFLDINPNIPVLLSYENNVLSVAIATPASATQAFLSRLREALETGAVRPEQLGLKIVPLSRVETVTATAAVSKEVTVPVTVTRFTPLVDWRRLREEAVEKVVTVTEAAVVTKEVPVYTVAAKPTAVVETRALQEVALQKLETVPVVTTKQTEVPAYVTVTKPTAVVDRRRLEEVPVRRVETVPIVSTQTAEAWVVVTTTTYTIVTEVAPAYVVVVTVTETITKTLTITSTAPAQQPPPPVGTETVPEAKPVPRALPALPELAGYVPRAAREERRPELEKEVIVL